KGEAFGGRDPAVLWAGGQARKLSRGREFVAEHRGSESADCLATVPPRSLDRGQETESVHGHTAGNPFSNQARNRVATPPRGCRSRAAVLADAAHGNDTAFRDGITELGLLYAVGIQSSVSAWAPGQAPLPKRKWKGIGRPTKLLRRDSRHAPLPVR